MGAKLIRHGHINVKSYRIGFFKICLEEIEDYISDNIRYNALAHRASKSEQADFDKFMKEVEPKSKTKKVVEVDHEAQMKMLKDSTNGN